MKIFLAVIVLLILFFVTVMVIDCHRFVIRDFKVSDPKIREKMRIVFLSDLHSVSFGKNNERLKAAVRSKDPDIVILGGDIYTASKSDDLNVSLDLVSDLVKDFPVYHVDGNHERKTFEDPEEFDGRYETYISKIRELDVNVINNEKRLIGDGTICLTGLSLPMEFFRKSLKITPTAEQMDEFIGKRDEDHYNVLVAHNPEYINEYALWGADLVLSGHVHGGLMRLPFIGGFISPKFRLFPKISGGRYDVSGTVMILSCGLGYHTLPIRIFNPGELTVVDLIPGE